MTRGEANQRARLLQALNDLEQSRGPTEAVARGAQFGGSNGPLEHVFRELANIDLEYLDRKIAIINQVLGFETVPPGREMCKLLQGCAFSAGHAGACLPIVEPLPARRPS